MVDVFTGNLGEIGGYITDCMSGGEAENMADTMNARDLAARAVVRPN